MNKFSFSDIVLYGFTIAVGSAVFAVLLEIVYIIGFFIFHDCGKFICIHTPDISWRSYFICFLICYVFFALVLIYDYINKPQRQPQAQNVKPTPQPKKNYHASRLSTSTNVLKLERDLICSNCGKVFNAVGEGNLTKCPYCNTDLECEMQYITTCYYCYNKFAVVGDPEFTRCPYCSKIKRLKTKYIRYSQEEQSWGGDDLETDYYDSDMEGAPGYNGDY